MSCIKENQIVNALPPIGSRIIGAVYYVKNGSGFDEYVIDLSGNAIQSNVSGGGGVDPNAIKKDGSVTFTSSQSMGGNKLTNLGTATASGDALSLGQFQTESTLQKVTERGANTTIVSRFQEGLRLRKLTSYSSKLDATTGVLIRYEVPYTGGTKYLNLRITSNRRAYNFTVYGIRDTGSFTTPAILRGEQPQDVEFTCIHFGMTGGKRFLGFWMKGTELGNFKVDIGYEDVSLIRVVDEVAGTTLTNAITALGSSATEYTGYTSILDSQTLNTDKKISLATAMSGSFDASISNSISVRGAFGSGDNTIIEVKCTRQYGGSSVFYIAGTSTGGNDSGGTGSGYKAYGDMSLVDSIKWIRYGAIANEYCFYIKFNTNNVKVWVNSVNNVNKFLDVISESEPAPYLGNASNKWDLTLNKYAYGGSAVYWVSATGGINYSGGNVGIANATPTEKLDIAGNAKVSGKVILTQDINLDGGLITTTNINQRYQVVNKNTDPIINIIDNVWNGSAWTTGNSYGFGSNALLNNKGVNCNGLGNYSLRFNTGLNSNGFGYASLQNNKANYSNGFGNYSLQNNTGLNSNGFGLQSLQYNNWNYVTRIGNDPSNFFNEDSSSTKSFTDANITVASKTITITGHGFGTGFKNLKFKVVSGTAPTGLTDNSIYQCEIIDANTIKINELTTAGSGSFSMTNSINITGSTAIGYNAYNTQQNEVVIGGTSNAHVVLKGVTTATSAGKLMYIDTNGEVRQLSDGIVNQLLKTDGSGNYSWASVVNDLEAGSAGFWKPKETIYTAKGIDTNGGYASKSLVITDSDLTVSGTNYEYTVGDYIETLIVKTSSSITTETKLIIPSASSAQNRVLEVVHGGANSAGMKLKFNQTIVRGDDGTKTLGWMNPLDSPGDQNYPQIIKIKSVYDTGASAWIWQIISYSY